MAQGQEPGDKPVSSILEKLLERIDALDDRQKTKVGQVDLLRRIKKIVEFEIEQRTEVPHADIEEMIREGKSYEEIQARLVEVVMAHCRGNVSKAARLLKIGRTTFYRWIEKKDD